MWFKNLPATSISSFQDLSEVFITYYFSNQKHIRTLNSLFLVKQRNNESLREFVSGFKDELHLVDDVHFEGAAITFKKLLTKDSRW